MAISGVWFLQIELGAVVMVSTIVIGALENNATKDVNEFLTMTSEEASWFGEYSMKINTQFKNKALKYELNTTNIIL